MDIRTMVYILFFSIGFPICFPICFVARYLRKIAIYLEKKEGAE
jgi:hypothetical protein